MIAPPAGLDVAKRPLAQLDRIMLVSLNGIAIHSPPKFAPVEGDRDFRLSRGMDLLIAALALAFFAPLMLILASVIRLGDGGPALYRQARVGRGGRLFYCLKLRTMVMDSSERLELLLKNNADARQEWDRDHKLRNDPRVTKLGVFLRKSSLDELPQLFNVIRGEMSVVGPRPIVPAEITRDGRRFRFYCEVRPGITGLWQVSGRNNVSYRRRVAMDTLYVRSKSFKLELMVLLKTIPAVLLRRGSY